MGEKSAASDEPKLLADGDDTCAEPTRETAPADVFERCLPMAAAAEATAERAAESPLMPENAGDGAAKGGAYAREDTTRACAANADR